MAKWQHDVDQYLRSHLGVASTSQLTDLGMSRSTIHRWAAEERLVRLLPGTFLSSQVQPGLEQWCAAVCVTHPLSVIGFSTASRLWHHRGVRHNGLHVLVPHSLHLDIPGVIVHRCRRIDPVDVVHRPDGIRLTSPPRTVFDSADMLGYDATRSIIEQLLHERICTLDTIIDTFSRLAHPHRPGTRILEEVLRSKPKWQRALQSDLELKVLDEIRRQGIPEPVAQCPVRLPDGSTIHLDFGWPEWKVGLEVDDPAWHTGAAATHRDARRDRKAGTIGWSVPRVTRTDVETGLRDAISDVAELLARRASAA